MWSTRFEPPLAIHQIWAQRVLFATYNSVLPVVTPIGPCSLAGPMHRGAALGSTQLSLDRKGS